MRSEVDDPRGHHARRLGPPENLLTPTNSVGVRNLFVVMGYLGMARFVRTG
jgi:hypothetical protein